MTDDNGFDKLDNALEALDAIIEAGPTDTQEAFLEAVRNSVQDITTSAELLTIEDVDAEYNEDENEGDAHD